MITIESLEAAAAATFDLEVGKATDGTPVGFRLRGRSSAEYQQVERAVQVRNVQLSASRNRSFDPSQEADARTVVEAEQHRQSLIVAACVADWFGFGDASGNAVPFSADMLSRVLAARPSWREKIVEAVEADGNFTSGFLAS